LLIAGITRNSLHAGEPDLLFDVGYNDVLEQPIESPDDLISYAKGSLSENLFIEVYYAKNNYAEKYPNGSIYKPAEDHADSHANSNVNKETKTNSKPNSSKGTPNVVINIHGGCWLSNFDIAHSRAFATALNNHGFDVYNIEYRRTGNGGEWPVAFHDVNNALNTIKNNVAKNSRVYLIGHSAGGHLALLAGYHLDWPGLTIVGLAPIVDLVAYAKGENSCQSATQQFMQGMPDKQPNEYQRATIKNKSYSTGKAPIILIGTNDQIVKGNYSHHANASLISIDGAGHFDFIHPNTTAFAQLLSIIKQ